MKKNKSPQKYRRSMDDENSQSLCIDLDDSDVNEATQNEIIDSLVDVEQQFHDMVNQVVLNIETESKQYLRQQKLIYQEQLLENERQRLTEDMIIKKLEKIFNFRDDMLHTFRKITNYQPTLLDGRCTFKTKEDCLIEQDRRGTINCPLPHLQVMKFMTVRDYRHHLFDAHKLIFRKRSCGLCESEEMQVGDFSDHVFQVHGQHICSCQRTFKTKLQLVVHLRSCLTWFKQKDQQYKPSEPDCYMCSQSVPIENIQKHMSEAHYMHPCRIGCLYCKEKGMLIADFIQHMKVQHVIFQCTCAKFNSKLEKFTSHVKRCPQNYKLEELID